MRGRGSSRPETETTPPTKTAVTFDKVGLGLSFGLIRVALGGNLERQGSVTFRRGFIRILGDSIIGIFLRDNSWDPGIWPTQLSMLAGRSG